MKIKSPRILAHPFPTTPDLAPAKIKDRLAAAAERVRGDGWSIAASDDDWDDLDEITPDSIAEELEMSAMTDSGGPGKAGDPWPEILTVDGMPVPAPVFPPIKQRAMRRAVRFFRGRKKHVAGLLAHLKQGEDAKIKQAVGAGRLAGIVTQHQMHERIAALHEGAPWLAPASAAVMAAMNQATRGGSAALTMTPLILTGPPGIGKSQWARELARLFAVPTVEVDIGATNGATFALSGVERGWGTAEPGRLVEAMLQNHVANPLVIIDEIDKIPDGVLTTKGTILPGAFEVLKSMIEPTTARQWTCPYYRVPFNLTAVNWVMTTNSVETLSPAFRDRCKVIELQRPTSDQLLAVAQQRIAAHFPDHLRAPAMQLVEGVLRQREQTYQPTSLRQLGRILDRVREVDQRQMLV